MWATFRTLRLSAPLLAVGVTSFPQSRGTCEENKKRFSYGDWDNDWDHRNSPLPLPPANPQDPSQDFKPDLKKKRVVRHLYLIRHGQYVSGKEDKERFLTDLGRQQATETGKRLKGLNVKFTKLTYSTMTRATETGLLVAAELEGVPTTSCDFCREGAPIPPVPTHSTWKPEPYEFFEDGARIEAAFRKYFHRPDSSQEEDSHEIIVCHGNVIRYWVLRALQLPPEAWLRIAVNNGSITKIHIGSDGNVSLRQLGDIGHFATDLQTYS